MNNFKDWVQFASHMWPREPQYTPEEYPDLSGRVYIVTGGSSGVGYHTARYLLQANAKVWLVARDEKRLQVAADSLKRQMLTNSAHVEFFQADLSDLTTIKRGVEQFLKREDRLDGVVHNAGVMYPEQDTTAQGFEYQVGVNCIGPWLLQRHLNKMIEQGSKVRDTRIIWVSSGAHMYADKDFDWEHVSKNKGYGVSKAINITQSILWTRRHPELEVASLSVHPGNLRSGLQRNLKGMSKMFRETTFYDAHYGALTELYALLHPKFEDIDRFNNSYIIPFGEVGHARQDIIDAANGDRGMELMKWLDQVTDEFM